MTRHARTVVALALAAASGSAGCTEGGAGIPTGAPEEVLAAAPSRTERGSAGLSITSDIAQYAGVIDFDGDGDGEVRPVVEKGAPPAEAIVLHEGLQGGDDPVTGATSHNPFLAIDLVRGATEIRPFGGRQVRGGSSLQYRVEIDVDRAVERAPDEDQAALTAALEAVGAARRFTADIFIDAQGRITRIDLPRDLASPTTKNRRGYRAITTIELDWPD